MSENIIPDENLPIYLQNYTVNIFCYEKFYNEEETCDSEPYGCCSDGVTSKDSPLGNNCIPECGSSKYSTVGIFPSNKTQKRVWNFKLAGKFQPHEGNYVIQYNFQKVDYQDISITFENLLSGNLNVCGRTLNMSDCSYYRFYPKTKILQIVIQSDKWQFYIKRETYFYMDILINDSFTSCNTNVLVGANNINTRYIKTSKIGTVSQSIDFTLPTLAFPNGIDACICSEKENCNSDCCTDVYIPFFGNITLPNPANNTILSLNQYIAEFTCTPTPSSTYAPYPSCLISECNTINFSNYWSFVPSFQQNIPFSIQKVYTPSPKCTATPSTTPTVSPAPIEKYLLIDASVLYLNINDKVGTSYPFVNTNEHFFINFENVNFGSFKLLYIVFNRDCFSFYEPNTYANIEYIDVIINGQTLNISDNTSWISNKEKSLPYFITESGLSPYKDYIISCQSPKILQSFARSSAQPFSELEFFGTGSSTEKTLFLELVDTATQENPQENLELEINVNGEVYTITTSFPQTKSNGYNEPTEPTTNGSTPFTIGSQYAYSYDLSSILGTTSKIYLIYYVVYSSFLENYYPSNIIYTYCSDDVGNCENIVPSPSCIFTCSSCS